MKTLQVFDPARCCSTGVCGVDVDQAVHSRRYAVVPLLQAEPVGVQPLLALSTSAADLA